MRVVIDLQGAQSTGSRNRGIGRYSLSLAKAIVRNQGEHEVFIALNGLFPDAIESIRASFSELLPQECIRVWQATGPVGFAETQNDTRRHVAELIYEQFLASLSPDVVLVTSLFEGLGDDAVTSVHKFCTETPTAVILYDLIPLIYSKVYLGNPSVEQWYKKKVNHIQSADLLLSISASSGQEAIKYLNFDSQQVCNISTAADDHFRPAEVSDDERNYLAGKYGLVRPFVMYTGGIDHRKNIERLISAYAQLPADLRREHQLAVVCSIQQPDRERLSKLAREEGLSDNELILTGFVPEEDLLVCYRACKFFVFPSWHEGFGLPVLEAMQCGKAAIASNTSSLPEVVGREDALFDPFDTNAITSKMVQLLEDDAFRNELECHGPVQARQFSWDGTAKKAWQALEAGLGVNGEITSKPTNRPRLAYVSPLPPEASGISDYSAELLPELAKHYCIEVIVAQEQVADAWVRANCPIRDVAWFRQHAHEFDRILYHFGNSHFHGHMFDLLHDHPGVVMLHDFFLSGSVAHLDVNGANPGGWARVLLESHGWAALAARFQTQNMADVVFAYPCNLQVLQEALGVIVHSDYARKLAHEWYGDRAADDWHLIPLMRKPAGVIGCKAARRALDVAKDEFVVCSFGHLGPTKLNHRLLAAWLASPLAQNKKCRLVFVGQNGGSDYGAELERTICNAVGGSRIEITGWVDSGVFHQWLAAADVGVQLRTLSRGETSAAVMDCMNYGLATIVNANGAMAELDQDAVWMLPESFDDSELTEALTKLQSDKQYRSGLGQKARQIIGQLHDPGRCAAMYVEAIEGYYQQAAAGIPGLLTALAGQQPAVPSSEWPALAACIAKNTPPSPRCKQLLVDISELVQQDARSGILRVVRSVLARWLRNPPAGWRIEPVYGVAGSSGYRYARCFTRRFLGVPEDDAVVDEPVEGYAGDSFLGLDLEPCVIEQAAILQDWHRRGVTVQFVVYDILPLLMPNMFPSQAEDGHRRWLETVAQFDGAICISRAVAEELRAYGIKRECSRERPFAVQWFHLGADPENSAPSRGMPAGAPDVLSALRLRPSFLSVGTIEPRKGHAQTLAAFETLWAQGVDANLVLVGKQGWMVEALVEQLRDHSELGKRLFWLEGISDEYLEQVYAASSCLIAASEGEGFGLPLIEAAQHKLPLIIRDIPVFREVAGEHAFYFENSKDPRYVAEAVAKWLELNARGEAPQSEDMPWLTWEQSAQQLMDIVLRQNKFNEIGG